MFGNQNLSLTSEKLAGTSSSVDDFISVVNI